MRTQPRRALPYTERDKPPNIRRDAMYDVLVIGTGIAGLSAAVSAAQTGARVALASAGKLFSGSSFYPGTWGLGLIAPADDGDAADLATTIKHVGCGVAVPSLVDAFAHGIRPALAWLQDEVGVELMEPSSTDAASQKAFIPCFDYKHRQWRGLTRQSMQGAFANAIDRFDIELLERHELVDLMDRDDRLAGALFLNTATKRFAAVGARAVILATGGTSGLFGRTLTSRDVLGSAQGIALKHGCSLINIEFMQMMPGLLSPARGVVFNEKTFRYAVPRESLDRARYTTADLLEMRSGYGPFTSRLASRAVDFAIDSAGEDGWPVTMNYPKDNVPEFVQTFSSWLKDECHVEPDAPLRLGMYAHASNGGIRINSRGETGVAGLYACGEATGGMHGADRIGGLSSANGVVFGRAAGKAAAQYARVTFASRGSDTSETEAPLKVPVQTRAIEMYNAAKITGELHRLMSGHCMIRRTEDGLNTALEQIADLEETVRDIAVKPSQASDSANRSAMLYHRLSNQLLLARAMVEAMRERSESRGSHARADYPQEDPALAHPSHAFLTGRRKTLNVTIE